MGKFLRIMRWLTALGTLLILALFAWQCIDIYISGNSPSNLDVNGVHILNVYRMEDVTGRLKSLTIPLVLYAVLLIACCVFEHCVPQRLADFRRLQPAVKQASFKGQIGEKQGHINIIRSVLCALAILFIVLGVMNGGWYDVLVKAINICTECIGLG